MDRVFSLAGLVARLSLIGALGYGMRVHALDPNQTSADVNSIGTTTTLASPTTIRPTEDQEKILDDFVEANSRLYHKLITDYSSEISPLYTIFESPRNRSKVYPPQAFIEMILTHARILTLEESDEKITMSLEFLMKWYDRRLRWNPEDFGGIQYIYIERSVLWAPELYFVDSTNAGDTRPDFVQNVKKSVARLFRSVFRKSTTPSGSRRDQPRCLNVGNVKVHNDGLCTFFTHCAPTVNCPVLILSQVAPEMQTTYSRDSEWEITKVDVINELIIYENDTEKSYENDAFIIEIRREPMFYVAVIVIPAFLITTLSIFGIFAMDADEMLDGTVEQAEKMNIGLTSLMSMVFLIGIVADSMPKSGAIPRLAVYVLVNSGLLGLSVLFLVIIPMVNRYYKKMTQKRKKPDTWFGKIVQGIVRIILNNYVLLVLLEASNFLAFGLFFR